MSGLFIIQKANQVFGNSLRWYSLPVPSRTQVTYTHSSMSPPGLHADSCGCFTVYLQFVLVSPSLFKKKKVIQYYTLHLLSLIFAKE